MLFPHRPAAPRAHRRLAATIAATALVLGGATLPAEAEVAPTPTPVPTPEATPTPDPTAQGDAAVDAPDNQTFTASGVVRTLVNDNRRWYQDSSWTASTERILDVDGVLLRPPADEAPALADGQRVTVTLSAEAGLSLEDALQAAGGAASGAASVVHVAPDGEAPAPGGVPSPSGTHTIVVLPIYWDAASLDQVEGEARVVSGRFGMWDTVSGGNLTTQVVTREPLVAPGTPTCDPLSLYNQAIRAHGEPVPTSRFEHIAVASADSALTCYASHAVLGGSQLWPTDAPAHDFGHNLGLGHAGVAASCPAQAPFSIGPVVGCTGFVAATLVGDVMGQYSTATGLHEPFRDLLGWGGSITAQPDRQVVGYFNPESGDPTRHGFRVPLSDGEDVFLDGCAIAYAPSSLCASRIVWDGGMPNMVTASGAAYQDWTSFVQDSPYAVHNFGWYATVSPRSLDAIPPSAPVITGPADGTVFPQTQPSFTLQWAPATDEGLGVASYRIYINDRLHVEEGKWTTSRRYVEFPSGAQRATFRVDAVDAAGNVTRGVPVVLKQEGPAPAALDVQAVVGYSSAHLSWQIAEAHPALLRQQLWIYPTPSSWPVPSQALPADAEAYDVAGLSPGHYTGELDSFNGMYPYGSASVTFDINPPIVTASTTTTEGHAPVTVAWTLGPTTAVPPASFRITVDGVQAATAPGDASSTVVPMSPGEHQYSVTAVDPWGGTATSPEATVSVAPDEPLHSVSARGTVRTLISHQTVPDGSSLILDVGGILLPLPGSTSAGLSDGEPVMVTFDAPLSMDGARAALAAGLPGGSVVSRVTSVASVGPPAPTGLPADGQHTISVLPVAWPSQAVPINRGNQLLSAMSSTWRDGSSGHLTITGEVAPLARLSGPRTCDLLAEYNATLVAHGLNPALGAREHVVVYLPQECGWSHAAVLGGHQMWARWNESNSTGTSWSNAFGHNLGLLDSGFGGCSVDGAPTPPSVSCWFGESTGWQDKDVMREPGAAVTAATAVQLGWMSGWAPSPTGPLTGNLRVGGATSATRPLVIPLSDGRKVVVEANSGGSAGMEARVVGMGHPLSAALLPSPRGRAELLPGDVYDIPGSEYVLTVLTPTTPGVPRVRVTPRSYDVIPPTAPVITTPRDWAWESTAVSWQAASGTGSELAGYEVVVDAAVVARVPAEATSANIPLAGGSHSLQVRAIDSSGNVTSSAATAVTVAAKPDFYSLALSQVDSSTIDASWTTFGVDTPRYTPTTGLSVDVSPGGYHVDLPSAATTVRLEGLQHHALYTVTVRIRTGAGDVTRSETLWLTDADSWVSLTAQDDYVTDTPFHLGIDVGPGLVSEAQACIIRVDGAVARAVVPTTRDVAFALPQGQHEFRLTCLLKSGLETGASSLTTWFSAATSPSPFVDVSWDHPFVSHVAWLFNRGITTGYADGTYHPAGSINRDAMAAFLFRYAGADIAGYQPPATPRFSDVPTSHPFYREISWMAEQGISTGYPDGTYRPGAPVSRDAMAAFLHRFSGAPTPADPHPGTFSDVGPSHPFATPISWLASAGITTGYSDGTYRPGLPIARDAMAAFLARMDTQWPRNPLDGLGGAAPSCAGRCATAV